MAKFRNPFVVGMILTKRHRVMKDRRQRRCKERKDPMQDGW